jgi:hypothetical protein
MHGFQLLQLSTALQFHTLTSAFKGSRAMTVPFKYMDANLKQASEIPSEQA